MTLAKGHRRRSSGPLPPLVYQMRSGALKTAFRSYMGLVTRAKAGRTTNVVFPTPYKRHDCKHQSTRPDSGHSERLQIQVFPNPHQPHTQ